MPATVNDAAAEPDDLADVLARVVAGQHRPAGALRRRRAAGRRTRTGRGRRRACRRRRAASPSRPRRRPGRAPPWPRASSGSSERVKSRDVGLVEPEVGAADVRQVVGRPVDAVRDREQRDDQPDAEPDADRREDRPRGPAQQVLPDQRRPGHRLRRRRRVSPGLRSAALIAAAVLAPTTPSAVRPWACWKAVTACAVAGPKLPSAVRLREPSCVSAFWSVVTSAPVSPVFRCPAAGSVTFEPGRVRRRGGGRRRRRGGWRGRRRRGRRRRRRRRRAPVVAGGFDPPPPPKAMIATTTATTTTASSAITAPRPRRMSGAPAGTGPVGRGCAGCAPARRGRRRPPCGRPAVRRREPLEVVGVGLGEPVLVPGSGAPARPPCVALVVTGRSSSIAGSVPCAAPAAHPASRVHPSHGAPVCATSTPAQFLTHELAFRGAVSAPPELLERYARVLVGFALERRQGHRARRRRDDLGRRGREAALRRGARRGARAGGTVIGDYSPSGAARSALEIGLARAARDVPPRLLPRARARRSTTGSRSSRPPTRTSSTGSTRRSSSPAARRSGPTARWMREEGGRGPLQLDARALRDAGDGEGGADAARRLLATRSRRPASSTTPTRSGAGARRSARSRGSSGASTRSRSRSSTSRATASTSRVAVGEQRRWLGGTGRNIPSFEIFTSPDWRGTEGTIAFTEPLHRYGGMIEGIRLRFERGRVVEATATRERGAAAGDDRERRRARRRRRGLAHRRPPEPDHPLHGRDALRREPRRPARATSTSRSATPTATPSPATRPRSRAATCSGSASTSSAVHTDIVSTARRHR